MRTKSTIFDTLYAYIDTAKMHNMKPKKWRLSPLAFELVRREVMLFATSEYINPDAGFLPSSLLGTRLEVDPAVLWVELALEDNRMVRDGVIQFDK